MRRNKLWKVREFRPKHGTIFPLLPRRPGLCPYPVVEAGALFFKRRIFWSLFSETKNG